MQLKRNNTPLFTSRRSSVIEAEPIQFYEAKDLEISREVIGRGSFGVVRGVRLRNAMRKRYVSDDSSVETEAESEASTPYVLKQIRTDTGSKDIMSAVFDFVVEAQFLSTLAHKNIIQMRGYVGQPGKINFSLVLERLQCTLADKYSVWREQLGEKKGWLFNDQEKALWAERLTASLEVAGALKYLHEQNIVYRDLKPENVGFDFNDTVKLFDFGLAKNLDEADKNDDDSYHATGLTGTRRYMAPEVALSQPYGCSADVYSFGILMWETLMLEKPYTKYQNDLNLFCIKVYHLHRRPKLPIAWPNNVKMFLRECWEHDPTRRIDFRDAEIQ